METSRNISRREGIVKLLTAVLGVRGLQSELTRSLTHYSFYDNHDDDRSNSRFVFNVKGNHYRIVALLLFQIKRVYIRWVVTHKDYDKIKNIDKI